VTPTTALGALIVGALVPGYLYLTLTEKVRRPRDQTPLAEVLQVALVGAATTGVAAAVVALTAPATTLDVVDTWRTAPTEGSAPALREAVAMAALVIAIALTLAWLLAKGTKARAKQRFAPTVLQGALGRPRRGTDRWVGVQLEDGTTYDGRLSAYPFTDDRDKLLIAIEEPIRRYKDKTVTDLPFDRPGLSGGDITSISLRYCKSVAPTFGDAPKRKRLAAAVARLVQHYADR
jgi:hypothetical protein